MGLLVSSTAFGQSTTSGAIQGTVTDELTGVPLGLVTVTASSPALQQPQSEFTDDAGSYFLSNLPPGAYLVVFDYNNGRVRREGIVVSLGKTVRVNVKMKAGEVITINQRAPVIDSGSTKQGTTMEQDYLTKVPQRGRTYDQVIGAAAGSQGDLLGTSFGGSTSLENSYVVDGINTTGLSFGTVGSPLLNNFIQEIEVITGGYNAEFGRATGGIINVITKTGSNEFHGSVWGQFVPFEADREKNPVAGNALVGENNLARDFDFGFELGGPVVKDRVWFYVGFAPTLNQRKLDRVVQTQVDRAQNLFDYGNGNCARNSDNTCDGDGNPDTTPAAGCELTSPSSCEGDGVADVDANGFSQFEEVDRTQYRPTTTTYQFLGKVNFAVTPDHQGQIGLNGSYGNLDVMGIAGTPTATQTDRRDLTTDVSAKWTSKFNNNRTQVDAVFGWHRYKTDQRPHFDRIPGSPSMATVDTPQTQINEGFTLGQLGTNSDVPESDRVMQFCTDGGPTDQFPGIDNCPVNLYALNSPGAINDQEENRYTAKLTLTQRVKLAGHHQFKIGGDYEQNVLDDSRNYTGGRFLQLTPGGGLWRDWRFVDVTGTGDRCLNGFRPDVNPAGAYEDIDCAYLDTLPVHGVTANWSGFVQDSWSILPNLTVNAGLRYEEQRLRWAEQVQDTIDPITGQSIGSNALSLRGLFAPRLGVIYDWTKEGRSKVYASWGRFYESIPMDINLRSFGGEVQYRASWFSSGATGQCGDQPMEPGQPQLPSLPENCPTSNTADPRSGAMLGSGDPTIGTPDGVTLVMPGMKAQYMDEVAAGVEYELLPDLRVGVSYQNRRIGRVIEDMSTDGGTTYFLGNPGEFDEGAEQDLEQALMDAEDGSEIQAALAKRLSLFRAVREFDKPTRDYHALQLTAVKRFSRSFMMQASYTLSRLEGNFPGLFSPDTGQVDPNITSQYDLVELFANRYGPLPADRPHLFKVDGYYTFNLGSAGRLTTGVRVRGQSGIPKQTLGGHDIYGAGETFILPRGSAGRTPFTFGSDLQVAYSRRIGKMDLEVYDQLLDVLNLQQVAATDDEYTTDFVLPISGGDQADLPYLKDYTTGATAQRKLNFGNSANRQLPLFTRIGATLSF